VSGKGSTFFFFFLIFYLNKRGCIKLNFIKLGNEVATLEYLTPNDLYVYSYLYMWQRFGHGKLNTSIGILHREIKLLKKEADNRKRIRESLEALCGVGLISCTGDDVCVKIKLEKEWSDCFTLIPSMLYEKVSTPEEWAVICYILRWGAFRSKISYHEFSVALKCSYKTAFRVIQQMEEKGLISVEHGKYMNLNSVIRQEINQYRVDGGVCGESAAHEMVRMKGFALMAGDQRIVDDISKATRIYYERDYTIVSVEMGKYSVEKKKQMLDNIKKECRLK